ETVWGWIHDPGHVVEALVAERGGALVGLAHYRAMPSPLRGIEIGFLDDLFVDPAARGAKVGEALLARLNEISAERGWNKIRWITGDDNYRARTLYDRVAVKTAWNLYEMTP
ncbi:MAG: GNAT family N-acetyltransferase, partial [Rhodospirillaceae bacterium]|nr:GNAT family N-acetyltransferase [Rhodospirillaceae bacterium]